MKLSSVCLLRRQLYSCMIPSAGWPAYVKTQAGKLLKELGVSSETIVHPELLKLVMYRHYRANVSDGLADTAATMVIVLPSQFKVNCLSRLTVADYALSCQLIGLCITQHFMEVAICVVVPRTHCSVSAGHH